MLFLGAHAQQFMTTLPRLAQDFDRGEAGEHCLLGGIARVVLKRIQQLSDVIGLVVLDRFITNKRYKQTQAVFGIEHVFGASPHAPHFTDVDGGAL
ncbi:hypothetical protein AC028_15435 [Xanthomonas citri pv. aurantifolii]|nr:hypothetical protein AC028_15435 [Xanthomonas citri pv. aurantifolii]ARE56439.1 hypothetical protein TP45_08865 [Xanthomonas citri pv. aurantifolii]